MITSAAASTATLWTSTGMCRTLRRRAGLLPSRREHDVACSFDSSCSMQVLSAGG